jgi:hypothetical protein
MANSLERAPLESSTAPCQRSAGHAVRTSQVCVVFTTLDETLTAIPVADQLARALGVPLTVVHLRAVPYPLQVDQPAGHSPIETDVFAERLRADGIDARVCVFLCRNPLHTVATALRPRSLVVIGGRRSWWPTAGERWRRTLEAQGHFVLFVDEAQHA